MTEQDHDGESIEEIASAHPSAGDDSQVEEAEQENNTADGESAADGGPGAGEDYAGSGF